MTVKIANCEQKRQRF